MSDRLHRVIGIDLGTTYSAVAAYDRYSEQAELLQNLEAGNGPTTPSVVAADPTTGRFIVGMIAKRNRAFDPANTIIEVKREMGEVFREETLDKFGARGTYRARTQGGSDDHADPVRVRLRDEWYMPQEISALILMKMKETAEKALGTEVRDAVITVPAYFTEKQKKATEEAALLAGLYPRQLIPEPTAAAICYGVDRLEQDRKVYLIYDFGGGTFDVSIITVEETKIDVVATSGDPRLGGGDLDDAVTEWAVDQLRESYGMNVAADPRGRAIIKSHAEQTKKDLSSFLSAKLIPTELRPQDPPQLELSRETFEGLIDKFLSKSLNYVDTAIRAAEKKGLRREDIDAILLVGGSSKIPKVKALLLEYFQRDESFVRADLDPDAVVARGAARVALQYSPTPWDFEILRRPDSSMINTEVEEDLKVYLITEHSLGIGVQDNLFNKIIDQGTNIPVQVTQGGFTNAGPTTHVEVPVYQGEGRYVYENTLIGKLQLGPMEPKPQAHHQFEVTFALDANGLLALTVNHKNEGKVYQAKFEQKTGVGGPEALVPLRNKLMRLYQPGGMEVIPGGQGGKPPAPVGPRAQPAAPAEVHGATPRSPAPSLSSAGAEPTSTAPAAAPATTARATATSAPPPGADAAPPSDGPAAIQGEVPEEFKSIVRRALRQMLNRRDPALVAAFNAFVAALNSGISGDELNELGDELADAYHDCRE